jgi:hypothetical protein
MICASSNGYRSVHMRRCKFFLPWLGGLLLSLMLAFPALAQMGTLRGSPGSQINVRTQPSTSAPAPSYGVPGDRVQILNSTRAPDGYTWYYVEFPQSRVRGWIRGDLVVVDSSGGGDVTQRVTFPPDSTGTSVSSTVRSYETRSYVLNARAGQEMAIFVSGDNRFLEAAVISPRGATLYVGTDWRGRLPNSGDYIVRIGLVRAEARRNGVGNFRLTLQVR